MRLMRNVIKDRHGTYYARKKVPSPLQEAVARALGNDKARQVWLKRSLDTKEIETANKRAKAVLIEFDRTLDGAKALLAKRPLVTSLSLVLIKRMAEYHYAHKLRAHDEGLKVAPEGEGAFRSEFPDEVWSTPIPEFGWSGGQMADAKESGPIALREAEAALAQGNIAHIDFQIEHLLDVFQLNLDRKCAAYQELGLALLRSQVKSIRAVERRFAGEPIETPMLPAIDRVPSASGETLKAAFEGWKRHRERSPRTLIDYERATKLFVELHGDMPVAQIRRTHARQLREALQDTPHKRTGKLLKAPLPELALWGREHPEAQKIGPGTVNKLLGGVQAVCRWARKEHQLPDDWADPFAEMRLEEDESARSSFNGNELQTIFETPVFNKGARPKGGQGAAAFWLPLLALFGGERLGELAGLKASDVAHNQLIGAVCIYVMADRKAGRRLKTRQSERFVPLHSQLIKLGFLDFVARQAKTRGEEAWLFPLVAPGTNGAAAFSKWFGRYIGAHGVTDAAKVFHSFRHAFTDALRMADVSDEVKHALLGWSGGGMPARYGAKDKAARFRHRLSEAVERVAYPELDLSKLTSAASRADTTAPRQLGS
jgi:integrase